MRNQTIPEMNESILNSVKLTTRDAKFLPNEKANYIVRPLSIFHLQFLEP